MSNKNWKITDSLFYPLGLFNNSGKNKVVFVAWSFDCLFTYIVKKIGDKTSLTDTYKVLLKGTIKNIIVTEYNTLVLMTNGQVYYFSSCKNLKRLRFLAGVKSISPREDGFALIRVNEENSIILETFQDFCNDENEAEIRRNIFDITFDDVNILNSSWKDEEFVLLAVQVKTENKKFLNLITKKEIIESDEIYFFTIYNSVFCLLPIRMNVGDHDDENNNYEINLVTTVSSQIENIRLMQSMNALLIFMSCGAIEIISYSNLTKLLDRTVHVMGTDLISSTFADDCFFYSDGQKIVQTELHYDEEKHICVVNEKTKLVPNIVALTWVRSFKKLVCLSENNIFYRTKFPTKTQPDGMDVDYDEFFELDDEKLLEIEHHLNSITDLVDEPKRIHKQIESEINMQEIITVVKRRDMYSSLISAVITFHNCIPELKETTIFPESYYYSFSPKDYYFIIISFKIIWNEIFKTGLWSLIIYVSSGLYSISRTVKLNQDLIINDFNVVISIRKEKFIIPPCILIEMASFINVERDFAYVSLPVEVKKIKFQNLLTTTTIMKPSMEYNRKTIDKLDKCLIDLAEKNNPLNSLELSEKQFCIKLHTPLIMSIDDLREIFHMSILEDGDESIEIILYFLGDKVSVQYEELDNYLRIETKNPVALFYTKLCIIERLSREYYDDEPINIQGTQRSLLKLQCEAEGRYGINCGENMYQTILLRLYKQLRNDIKKF